MSETKIDVGTSPSVNRRLVSFRLRELDVNFLLALIDWNEESGQHRGSKDRWECKREHVKAQLQGALAS